MICRLHRALLAAAAALVPADQRAEWLAELNGELWYMPAEFRTRYCLGAYKDALWLRWNNPVPRVYLASPVHCLALLTVLAALSIWFAFRIPQVRDLLAPPHYADARHLSTISSVTFADFRTLSQDPSNPYRELAYYCTTRTPVRYAGARHTDLSMAIAGRNLFQVLGVPARSDAGTLILSDGAWRYFFDADPRIVGRTVTVAGHQAKVSAVVSNRFWNLPGWADAWLLVDDADLSTSPDASSYLVGRAATPVRTVAIAGGTRRALPVSSPPPLLTVLIVLTFISCIVLPSLMPMAFDGYRATRLRGWAFLVAKIVLMLPIVLLGSLDVFSIIAYNLQAHAILVTGVIGLRWILTDQRRRCPTCLRILTNPASIGEPSRTLLDWYGTELVCGKGHGLLHVPAIATSYTESRWHPLDSSWSSLFS